MKKLLCFILISVFSMVAVPQAFADSTTLYAVEDAVVSFALPFLFILNGNLRVG